MHGQRRVRLHATAYGKGRWSEVTEGIRRSVFVWQIGNRADNPSVMLRMTAPFAQGSQGVGESCRRQPQYKGAMVGVRLALTPFA